MCSFQHVFLNISSLSVSGTVSIKVIGIFSTFRVKDFSGWKFSVSTCYLCNPYQTKQNKMPFCVAGSYCTTVLILPYMLGSGCNYFILLSYADILAMLGYIGHFPLCHCILLKHMEVVCTQRRDSFWWDISREVCRSWLGDVSKVTRLLLA